MTALTRSGSGAEFVRWRLLGLLVLAMLTLATAPLSAAETTYATPEAAMAAFRAAVYGEGGKGILDLFGREYEADLIGGDPAEARQNIQALRRMAAQRMTLEPDGEGMSIIMGRRGWQMPIPLVKGEGGWTFRQGRHRGDHRPPHRPQRAGGDRVLQDVHRCPAPIRRYRPWRRRGARVRPAPSEQGRQTGRFILAARARRRPEPARPLRRRGRAVPRRPQGGGALAITPRRTRPQLLPRFSTAAATASRRRRRTAGRSSRPAGRSCRGRT